MDGRVCTEPVRIDRPASESNLTPWALEVDIYETENELLVKADLPDVNPQDLDIRVEKNILTIRGERKFDSKVDEDNYLRIERSYGLFSRSFFAGELGEVGGHQGRLSEWRADAQHTEARGSEARADQGECDNASDGNACNGSRGWGSVKKPRPKRRVTKGWRHRWPFLGQKWRLTTRAAILEGCRSRRREYGLKSPSVCITSEA